MVSASLPSEVHFQARTLISQALDAVRAGANPNQPIKDLCQATHYLGVSDFSLLFCLVHNQNHALVKEVLALGATLEPRRDQPHHWMAVLGWGFWPSIGHAFNIPEFRHMSPEAIVSMLQSNIVEMLNALTAHGMRCDRQALLAHKDSIAALQLTTALYPLNVHSPLWGMLDGKDMTGFELACVKPVLAALMDKGVHMEWDGDQRASQHLIDLVECVRAEHDHRIMTQTIPQASIQPSPKKM